VTVDAGGVTARSLTFNTAGYTVGGGTIALNTGSIVQVVANQDVTLNAAFNKTGAGYFAGSVAAGKTLTLNGNQDTTNAGSEIYFQGNGTVVLNGAIGAN